MSKAFQYIDSVLERLFLFGKRQPVFFSAIIAFLFIVAVTSNVYFSESGKVTLTSPLILAKNLTEGNDFFLGLPSSGKEFYTTLPVGYPYLIALTSLITGLDVLIASKVLNIIAFLIIVVVLSNIYKNNAPFFAFIGLLASYLSIFSHTWTEGPFLLGLTLFLVFFSRYAAGFGNLTLNLAGVFVSILFSFLIRYIGAFTVLVVGILWIIGWIKHRKVDIKLLFTLFLSLLGIFAYLGHNMYQKGVPFTKGSISSEGITTTVQPFINLLGKFLEAFAKSLTIPLVNKFSWPSIVALVFVSQIALILLLYSYQKRFYEKSFKGQEYTLWKVSLISSFVYLLTFTIIRFTVALDDFNYRYFSPFIFLAFIGSMDYLLCQKIFYFRLASKFIVSMGLFSFLLNSPVKHLYNYFIEEKEQKTYPSHLAEIKSRYRFISDTTTAIAFGDQALDYRNLNVVTPTPISVVESSVDAQAMDAFLKELKQFQGEAYVEIKTVPKLDGPYHYHPSVRDFMEAHSEKSLVKIK